jgi:type II secretory pathway component GspD/PulD (secretin)
MAGLISKGEVASIDGIPLLAGIPGLGKAFSVHTKQNSHAELLITVTPHITSRREQRGLYLSLPTNVPK